MAADGLFDRDGAQEFGLGGMREYGSQEFGPDGTQEPITAAVLGDALGGLVTGPAFEPGDWSDDQQDSVYSTGATPLPPAPDQQPLRSAMDKAMMTGPPTNPLRVSRPNPARQVRPAPTVTAALPQIAPPLPQGSRRPPSTRLPSDAPARAAAARSTRSNLAGRPASRRRHPVVTALLRLAVLVIFVLVVLLLHNFGGTLSGLFS